MKKFYTAKDVSELLCCGISKAYQVIKELNQELQDDEIKVVAGRVSVDYFNKCYGVGSIN